MTLEGDSGQTGVHIMVILSNEQKAKNWLTGLIKSHSISILNGYWDSQHETVHVWVAAEWLPLLRRTLPDTIEGFPVRVSEMPEFMAQAVG